MPDDKESEHIHGSWLQHRTAQKAHHAQLVLSCLNCAHTLRLKQEGSLCCALMLARVLSVGCEQSG